MSKNLMMLFSATSFPTIPKSKTVSYETKQDLISSVSRGTWRPEDNVHAHKLKKLSRAIESWLMEYKYEGEWQIDVIAVKIVPRGKYATVKYIPNVIL